MIHLNANYLMIFCLYIFNTTPYLYDLFESSFFPKWFCELIDVIIVN